MISFFPVKTWKNRPAGLRLDLASMVEQLQPAFVRFPGGCFVEGLTLTDAYQWKTTIGDIASRPGHPGMWQYRSTDGLGFHEFLQWSEDLGAEPLYVVNVGISHAFGNVRDYEASPLDELQLWIQDALDAIEYANGPVTSKWGKKRAENGHPEPFNLKYIEIGNENNFQMSEYLKRYPLFYETIKAKYPNIQLIANAPMDKADIVDEHYYDTPEWFMNNADRYDRYDRSGPRIYVGEYAATKNIGTGNLKGALGEAAFMTGLERNSDIVTMASYAPLFVNDRDRLWNPDAIVFNQTTAYGTPSYYVQQLFASNKPDKLLPLTIWGMPAPEENRISGGIGVGTWVTQTSFKDVKVVSGEKTLYESDFSRSGGANDWNENGGNWSIRDGEYTQSSTDSDIRSTIGSSEWDNYTLTMKAQKNSGAEGMLIMFGVKDTGNYYWWNIGGWGNTKSAIEKSVEGTKSQLGSDVPIRIEENRWYDIQVGFKGGHILCYLDGDLIHDVTDQGPKPMYAVAGFDTKTGETIVKAINVSKNDLQAELALGGDANSRWSGTSTILTAGRLEDRTASRSLI